MKTLMLSTVFALISTAPGFAQDAPSKRPAQEAAPTSFDSRWNPYLGCWRIVQENVGDQSVPTAAGLMICVRPSGRSGVAVTTTVDGKNVLEQTIIADGSTQPVTQADCRGNQTSEWSRDGERLFTRVELECAGRPTRVVSGITQLARGFWIDAQATVVDGDHDVRLRRYQRTSDQFAGAPATGGGPMNVEDVIEASKKVLAPALEAALVETGGRFVLDSRTLKQLADAGVSPNVIDLMVAQAYPDRFQIERPSTYPPAPSVSSTSSSSGGGHTTVIMGSSPYPYPMYDPFYNSYYYYSPFAYPYYWGAGYYPYRYSYGYRNYNNNYYFDGGGNRYPRSHSGSRGTAQPGSPDHPGGDAIAVNGQGYTRVRPSGSSEDTGTASTPTQRTNTSGRGARTISGSDSSSSGSSSSGGSSSGSSSSGSSSSSSGSSSGSSSSGGNSSGGGGSSSGGGRTAQPK